MMFTSASFHPSSVPISLPHSSKLDNILEPFHVCPRHRVESCERPHLRCVIWNFSHCFEEHEMNHDKPMYQRADSAAEDCFEKLESVWDYPDYGKFYIDGMCCTLRASFNISLSPRTQTCMRNIFESNQ